MAGHGGDEFLKFQDSEEISSPDISNALEQMYEKKRYNKLLYMVDTCEATTLFKHFDKIPNIISVGSSIFGEHSYSHHNDRDIGVAIIDRFTYQLLDFFDNHKNDLDNISLLDLFKTFTRKKLKSTVEWKSTIKDQKLEDIKVTEFFSASIKPQIWNE